MKARHHTTATIPLHIDVRTRLKLLFGWRMVIFIETAYKTHDPGIIQSKSATATIPPWKRKEFYAPQNG